MDENKVLISLQNNIDKINKYGVKRIGLFGSYLRNEANEDSDIDILVEFNKDAKTFDNYMDLKFFLEKLFQNKKIDLVLNESIKPGLKKYIMNEIKYAS